MSPVAVSRRSFPSQSPVAVSRRSLPSLLFLAFAACHAPATDVPRTNLITGSTGSTWYRIGAGIAERTNAAFSGHPVTAIPGAGGVSNPARVGLVPGDLGLAFLPFLRAAYRGDAPFRRPFPELRHIATLLENKFHLIVAAASPIRSIADIKAGRLAVRIGTGPPGSGEEFLLREILLAYGITYEDIRSWGGRLDLLGSAERTDQFQDYHIDIIAYNINEPASLVTELLATRPGRFLSIDDRVRQELHDRWSTRILAIPAHTYPTQESEVSTVGLAFVVFATADVNEALVYQMTRAIAENQPYLETVHPGFKQWQPGQMLEDAGVPRHTGAARYYRERGWIE